MFYQKSDAVQIARVVELLKRGGATSFLDRRERAMIEPILKKQRVHYQVLEVYQDADKVIFYHGKVPVIRCFKIHTNRKLEHREVLGSLFGLSIASDVFGDILIEEEAYILVLDKIAMYIQNHFNMIGRERITLEEVSLKTIQGYQKKYIVLECNVASTRIDCVLAQLVKQKRSEVHEMLKKKEVLLNYEVVTSASVCLKERDVFSIRGYGKYEFIEIKKITKKERMVVRIKKFQ